jgi:hypothetical protein
MNCYEMWVNLAPGASDLEFADAVKAYLNHYQEQGLIHSWRLKRRKLGFGPEGLGQFWVTVECESLEKLDQAFFQAASRKGETDRLHSEVWSRVKDFKSALYRDFPDEVRQR